MPHRTFNDIYADTATLERIDYQVRQVGIQSNGRTVVLAPHGGGIEPGTSELCLAVAGYHPATLKPSGQVFNYWMFEGIRSAGNWDLHVASTQCDDSVVNALCSRALNAISLHGCTVARAEAGWQRLDQPEAVLVGGRNAVLRERVVASLARVGMCGVDASSHPRLSGCDARNIANRTLLGMGLQLELTAPLRSVMFGASTGADRQHTTTSLFWTFVNAVRSAIFEHEASQPLLVPNSRLSRAASPV